MQNETIDKLKNAGYITVTDDSQGIADKVGVPEAFPYEFDLVDSFLIKINESSDVLKEYKLNILSKDYRTVLKETSNNKLSPLIGHHSTKYYYTNLATPVDVGSGYTVEPILIPDTSMIKLGVTGRGDPFDTDISNYATLLINKEFNIPKLITIY